MKLISFRDQLETNVRKLVFGQKWPCLKHVVLVVGCESSGTTPIARLLLCDGSQRFLREGYNTWVWELYQSVYQGKSRVCDYPRLKLYPRIKVPGFAAILPQLAEEFPNASFVYCLRDPRDVVCSAYRTWKVTSREELANIDWVKQGWLGLKENDPVARLAHRWRIYLEQSYRVAGVRYIRYEDFCANKVASISELANELDIELDLDELQSRSEVQASEHDVRNYRPCGPGSWRTSGFLDSGDVDLIQSICGEQMSRWKYAFA